MRATNCLSARCTETVTNVPVWPRIMGLTCWGVMPRTLAVHVAQDVVLLQQARTERGTARQQAADAQIVIAVEGEPDSDADDLPAHFGVAVPDAFAHPADPRTVTRRLERRARLLVQRERAGGLAHVEVAVPHSFTHPSDPRAVTRCLECPFLRTSTHPKKRGVSPIQRGRCLTFDNVAAGALCSFHTPGALFGRPTTYNSHTGNVRKCPGKVPTPPLTPPTSCGQGWHAFNYTLYGS